MGVLEVGDRVVAAARHPEQLVELEDMYSETVRTVPLDVTNEPQIVVMAVHLANERPIC